MGLLGMFQMARFELAVGAEPDLRELEYLSALLQTDTNLRTDGTVSSEDIRIYLRSRYGLDVPPESALDVVRGLGGTYDEGKPGFLRASYAQPNVRKIMSLAQSYASITEPSGVGDAKAEGPTKSQDVDEYLDLVQLTSVLLIPSLLRAKREVDLEHGVILEDPPIASFPDTSFKFWLRHPILFWRNRKIAADLRKQTEHRDLKNSLRTTPRLLIRDVLRIIIDAVDDKHGVERIPHEQAEPDIDESNVALPLSRVVINETLVKKILAAFSFTDVCNDTALVREMVEIAGGEGTVLDEQVFARVLTSDVVAWKTGIEDETSETFADVFGFDPVSLEYMVGRRINRRKQREAEVAANGDKARFDTEDIKAGPTHVPAGGDIASSKVEWVSFDEEDGNNVAWKHWGNGEVEITPTSMPHIEQEHHQEGAAVLQKGGPSEDASVVETNTPKYISTAPYIDYVVDEYKSISYSMLLWGFFVFNAAAFVAILNVFDLEIIKCQSNFLCILVQQIWSWFVLGAVLSVGGLIVITPLSLGNDPYRKDPCGAIVSVIWAGFFAVVPYYVLSWYKDGIPHSPDEGVTDAEKLLQSPGFKLATVIYFCCGLLLAVKALLAIPTYYIPREKMLKSGWLRFLFLPSSVRIGGSTKQAATRKVNLMLEHAHSLHRQRLVGSKRTALENFVSNGSQVEECGGLVWTWKQMLSKRLIEVHGIWIQSNLFVGQEGQILVLIFGLILSIYGALALGEQAKTAREELEAEEPSGLRDRALYFTPKPWMIYYSFLGGTLVAGAVSVCLVLLYLPSTVMTVLKLRSGRIETLHEPKFASFRASADTICYNIGNMIYALIGSAALFFLVVAGALFLLFWPPTQHSIILLIGWGMGLGITIGAKIVVTMCLRSNFQAALYRKKPRQANFTMLILQCWQIGLGAGVILGRLIQFLCAAAFWTGRVDAMFLHDDVKIFGYSFDYVPFNYRKDILVHEAHRHPWIDRIGGMYMMRLKHGKRFGSNAGACWRQLFVVGLMPWLLKYRKSSIPDEEGMLELMVERALSPEDSKAHAKDPEPGGFGGDKLIRRKRSSVPTENVVSDDNASSDDDDSEWVMKSI